MKMFMVILLSVLGIVVISLWGSMAQILPSGYLPFAKAAALFLNIGATAIFFFFSFKKNTPTAALLINVVAVFIVAEIIFCLLVGGAVLWQKFCRYFYAVPFDPEKRALLKHSILYPLTALILSVYGSAFERKNNVVREFTVPVEGEFAPYKIAQLSDIHLGLFFNLDDLRKLLEQTAALKPDVLTVTGDLFDDATQNEAAAQILSEYTAKFPDGIYFCWGNHEYYRNIAATRRYLAKTPVKLLENEWTRVRGRLVFAGVDYPMDRANFDALRDSYSEKAFADLPADAVTVLLAHHPEFIDNAAEAGAVLTLTGHTHGSQFGILGYPLFPFFKYTRGIIKKNNSVGYVHCGNGSWFPLRLGCPPEIAVFTLKSAEK